VDIGGHPPIPLGPLTLFPFSFLISTIVTIFGSFLGPQLPKSFKVQKDIFWENGDI